MILLLKIKENMHNTKRARGICSKGSFLVFALSVDNFVNTI